MQVIELVKENCLCLYDAERELKNYKAALEYYTEFTTLKDSMLNDSKSREFGQLETKYKYEKKIEQERLEQEKRDLLAAEKLKRRNQQRNVLIGGVALISFFSIFIFNRYRLIGRQKKVIEEQKKEVDEKNKHITESIQYALRIQTAILPPEKMLKENLKNSFVLYLPKDIVAGDFYWMEVASSNSPKDGELILFAACDCTGHGVPGAMVSVMCHNALNRAVREYGLKKPGEILDKLVDLVADNFTKSEDEIQDGMDASLCAYYPKKRKLQWAGANNPLWLVRNSEIIEYKADKQPIGKYDYRQPYTNNEIELQQGDTIYIFSDGYADQFGEGDRKLTKKGLKNILLSMQDKTMEAQREELLKQHLQWKGKTEQIDDICVIGMRV